MDRTTIGVLGGIGAESSAEFYKRLVSKLQKKHFIKSNVDFPHIIINSIPAPELFLGDPDLSLYKKGIEDLNKFGADFIVIVCNTAHVFLEELQKQVKTPIIDLKKEVKEFLEKRNIKTVTVFGTHSTIKTKLFDFKNIKNKDPSPEDMGLLDKIIFNYVIGKNKQKQIDGLNKLLLKYKRKSQAILIACTELSSITKNIKVKTVDTMDILVEATIDKWRK